MDQEFGKDDLRDRYRGAPAHHPTPKHHRVAHPVAHSHEPAEKTAPKPGGISKHGLALFVGGVLVILAAAGGSYWYVSRNSSPVPRNIQSKVDFPIYYPDQKKLPTGYRLNPDSFKAPQANGVVYEVDYGNGKRMVFSVQPKPSDNALQTFNSSYIPLRTDYQTPSGTAEIGAYNDNGKITTETLVSLPTNDKTWLLITAPYDINQAQLKQVLSSLKK